MVAICREIMLKTFRSTILFEFRSHLKDAAKKECLENGVNFNAERIAFWGLSCCHWKSAFWSRF